MAVMNATALLVCLDDAPGRKICGGRVEWSRSTAGGWAGKCSRCHHQRRAVSGETPALEQLEADGRLASRLTSEPPPGPLV